MRKHLKFAIRRSGRTQREIARLANMREDRLSEVVCGATNPRDDEKADLCLALSTENTDDLWRDEIETALG